MKKPITIRENIILDVDLIVGVYKYKKVYPIYLPKKLFRTQKVEQKVVYELEIDYKDKTRFHNYVYQTKEARDKEFDEIESIIYAYSK